MDIPFHEASRLSLVIFNLVVFFVLTAMLYGATRVGLGRRFGAFLLIWVWGTGALVFSGILKENLFPGLPILFLTMLSVAVAIGAGPWGRAFATLPIWTLVLFQGFRLPLEIVLHLWAKSNTIPETMTWTGQNIDIISGIVALGILLPPFRTLKYAWFANGVGTLLLLNVIRVAVLSSPLPFAWPLENPLQLVLHMPYALIAFVCVWGAVLGHVVLTRALLTSKNARS